MALTIFGRSCRLVCGLVEISTSTSTWVICSRNIHFADTVKSVCVNQPTQSEHLQLKLNKQTVLYRLKIRFPHYIRYSQEVWNRLYHVIRGKSDHVTYFQNKSKWRHSMDLKRQLRMISCIWRHR
jgi:hypothetical protein